MHVALAEAGSGNVTHAIELAQQIQAPSRKDMALEGIALVQMKQGNSRGSLATTLFIGSELARAKTYREIATAQTQRGRQEEIGLWINGLGSPLERASALLGAANGLLDVETTPPEEPCGNRARAVLSLLPKSRTGSHPQRRSYSSASSTSGSRPREYFSPFRAQK